MYLIACFRLNLVRSSCTTAVQSRTTISFDRLFWRYSPIISAFLNTAVPISVMWNPQIFTSNDHIKKCDGSEADSELPKATKVFSTEFKGLTLLQCAFYKSYPELPCPQSPRSWPVLCAHVPWPAPPQAVGWCFPPRRFLGRPARLPRCSSGGSVSMCCPQTGSSCSLHCSQVCRSSGACLAWARCSSCPVCPVLQEGTSQHRLKVGWRESSAFPLCWRLFLPAAVWLLWPGLHRYSLVLDSQQLWMHSPLPPAGHTAQSVSVNTKKTAYKLSSCLL